MTAATNGVSVSYTADDIDDSNIEVFRAAFNKRRHRQNLSDEDASRARAFQAYKTRQTRRKAQRVSVSSNAQFQAPSYKERASDEVAEMVGQSDRSHDAEIEDSIEGTSSSNAQSQAPSYEQRASHEVAEMIGQVDRSHDAEIEVSIEGTSPNNATVSGATSYSAGCSHHYTADDIRDTNVELFRAARARQRRGENLSDADVSRAVAYILYEKRRSRKRKLVHRAATEAPAVDERDVAGEPGSEILRQSYNKRRRSSDVTEEELAQAKAYNTQRVLTQRRHSNDVSEPNDVTEEVDALLTWLTGADLQVQDVVSEMHPISLPKSVAAAQRFRRILSDCPVQLCAVCSTHCRMSEMVSTALAFHDLPGVNLLRADGPKTPSTPRHALTTMTIDGVSYCLQPDAVRSADGETSLGVCKQCHGALGKGKVPPGSLVRFDEGPWPVGPSGTGLETMTLVESAIVAPLRAFRLLLVCRPSGGGPRPPDSLQRAMRGNVVAIPKSTPADLSKIFPCTLQDIPEIILVVLIVAASTRKKSREIAKTVAALHVRGKLIVMWARHLMNVNRDDPSLRLDEDALRVYENIDEVPDSLADAAEAATTEAEADAALEAVRKRRAGYAATRYGSDVENAAGLSRQSAESGFMRGLDDVEMEMPGAQGASGIDALVAGVRQLDIVRRGGGDNENSAADVLRRGGVLASTTSRSGPFSDYDKRWGPMVHIMAFPNGTGQCPESEMTLESWFRTKLRRYPRKSNGQQVCFLLDFFNIIQRHQVNTQVNIQMIISPQLFRELEGISEDEVIQCARIIGSGKSGGNLAAALHNATGAVRALYKAYRSASSRVIGSPQSFASLRSKALSGWYIFGEWTMALNLNPSELNARICFELAGKSYAMDSHGRPAGNAPSMVERWRTIAANPVAVAEFFHIYMVAFSDAFLGWPDGADYQRKGGGIFGRITSKTFKYEASGRGGPHSHNGITQPAIQARMLPKLFANESFLSHTLTFVESLAQQWLPSPYRHCFDCATPQKDCARDHGSAVQLANDGNGIACGLTEYPLPTVNIARDGHYSFNSDDAAVDGLKKHLGRCVICLQHHSHTSTCAKGGGAATDEKCRLTMPRPELLESKVDADTACIFLRRQCGSLVAYNQAVMLGLPVNHAFYLMAESSRWLREYQLWKTLRDAGKTQAAAPVLPSVQVSAALAALYALKYATKADNASENSVDVRVAAAIHRGRERDKEAAESSSTETPAQDDQRRKLKRHVRQLCNGVDGSLTYPAALVALYGLGYGDHVLSYATATHSTQLFQQFVQHQGNTNVEVETRCDLVGDATGKCQLVNGLVDYLARSGDLEYIPPFAMTMCFRKANKDAIYYRQNSVDSTVIRRGKKPNERFSLDVGDHPQKETHMLMKRSKYVVPQCFTNPPYRPADEVEDFQIKDDYASFAIGNFACYRLDDFTEGGRWYTSDDVSLWDLYVSWRDSDMKAWIATVLDNVQCSVAAKKEASARFMARRRDVAEAGGQAGTDFADRADGILGLIGDDDDDDDEPRGQANEFDDAPDSAGNAMDMAAIEAMLEEQSPKDSLREARENYVADAAAAIPSVPQQALLACQPPADTEVVYRDLKSFTRDAKKWKAKAKAFRRQTAENPMRDADDVDTGSPSHHLVRTVGGQLRVATLEVIERRDLLPGASVGIVGGGVSDLSGGIPFVKLAKAPTMEDVIELHTLSTEQAFVFRIMAQELLPGSDLVGGQLPNGTPLRMVVQGEPGTGKSRSLVAFLWFAYQHGKSDEVAVLSYAARAALNISTVSNVGRTTCSFLEIDGFAGDKPRRNPQAVLRLQQALSGKKFILIDEFSFLSLSHLSACSEQCNLVTKAERDRDVSSTWDALDHNFGDFHIILFGDLFQHSPPRGTALHAGAEIDNRHKRLSRIAVASGSEKQKRTLAGRDVWESVDTAVILREQHRLTGDEDGEKLYRISRCFQRENVTRDEIEEACEELNSRAGLLDVHALRNMDVKVLALRQTVRHALNAKMIAARAATVKKRLYMWRSEDRGADGTALPPAFATLLENVPASNLGDIPTVGYFFPGIEYIFVSNESADAGHARNNLCTGRAIFLDEREPPDDLSKPYRQLQFQPLGICVEPDQVCVGGICGGQEVPENCIVIVPEKKASLTCVLPSELKLPNGRIVKDFKFSRRGIPLDYGYVVTDYFAQGLSFNNGRWYSHLNIPSEGVLSAASIYVALTRYRRWSDVFLLVPLWPSKSDPNHRAIRESVINRFYAATRQRPDSLRKECTRLESLAAESLNRLNDTYQWCAAVVDGIKSRCASTF